MEFDVAVLDLFPGEEQGLGPCPASCDYTCHKSCRVTHTK